MSDRELYDETGSKILVRALLAQDDIDMLSAINGLRRHMATRAVSPHDVKVFYAAGPAGTWMGSMMRSQAYERERTEKAQAETKRYKARLAVVEAAIRRMRNVLKSVAGSDTKDALLKWDIEKVEINDSDVSDDPADAILARLYEQGVVR